MTFDQALTGQVFAFLLIFTRLGTAFTLLPGFGDSYVSQRIRLLLALAVSFVVLPVLAPHLPPMPKSASDLFVLLGQEFFVGVFLGTISKLLMSALETAGAIIAMSAGLSAAQMFNPAMASQGTLPGALLGYAAVLLVFVTNQHHLLILAVVDSYELFVPGQALPIGDFADMITKLVAHSFAVGTQMAAPFLIFGFGFNLALGILTKMMPQLQIFTLIQSVQIAIGLFMFAVVMAATLMFWLRDFEDAVMGFLGTN